MDKSIATEEFKNFYNEIKKYVTIPNEYIDFIVNSLYSNEELDLVLSDLSPLYDEWSDSIKTLDTFWDTLAEDKKIKEIEKSFNMLTDIVNNLNYN